MVISKNQAVIPAGCRYPFEKFTFSDEIPASSRNDSVEIQN